MNSAGNQSKKDELIYPKGYNYFDKTKKKEEKIKKSRKHTLEAILVILAFVVSLIVLEIAIFSGFNSTKNKSKDVSIKSDLERIAREAFSYWESHGGSFQGFVPREDANITSWSGSPIFNLSSDGKGSALFIKSAEKKSIYYCTEPKAINPDDIRKINIYEVSEEYANAGNSSCFP